MKKTKIVIIFLLWIFLGWFVWQVKFQRNKLNQPIVQEGKLDLNGIIQSIWNVVNAKTLNFTKLNYKRFDEVYNILQNYYYDQDKLNTWVMIENALKAFVDGIDDPYTVYMDSNQNSGFQEEIKWEIDFEWIWIVISKKDYYVLVEEVVKGSPAFKAGLMVLDRIVAVNSGIVKDRDINQAMLKIKWPKWTKVTLTIERLKKDLTKDYFNKTITRDKLLIPSVTSQILTWKNNNKIWYINISIIGEETEKLLRKNISEIKSHNIKWIVLDLRWNGWWLLPIAVEIVSHFVPKWKLVVTAKYKVFEDEKYYSKWYGGLQKIPVVVLMDGMTASAWEIIALALQEQIGATLVGTQTFGKWSIQTMDEFKGGASLKYTIWKWYTPNGLNVDKTWATPNIEIKFDSEKYLKDRTDNQLQKAIEVFKF